MRVLVLGASLKESRYSNMAIRMLREHGHEVLAIGNREGEVKGTLIKKDIELYDDIHTITLYLNPKNQVQYYDYILSLMPERVIFNPGTENHDLYRLLEENGINYEIACTLVLLQIGQFESLK